LIKRGSFEIQKASKLPGTLFLPNKKKPPVGLNQKFTLIDKNKLPGIVFLSQNQKKCAVQLSFQDDLNIMHFFAFEKRLPEAREKLANLISKVTTKFMLLGLNFESKCNTKTVGVTDFAFAANNQEDFRKMKMIINELGLDYLDENRHFYKSATLA
jgi:hypothetical protein